MKQEMLKELLAISVPAEETPEMKGDVEWNGEIDQEVQQFLVQDDADQEFVLQILQALSMHASLVIAKPYGPETIVKVVPLGGEREREVSLFPDWYRSVRLGPMLNWLFTCAEKTLSALKGREQYVRSFDLMRLLKMAMNIMVDNQGSNSDADNVLAICACAEMYLNSAWVTLLPLMPDVNRDGETSLWGNWQFDASPYMEADTRKALAGQKVIVTCVSSIQALFALIRYCALNRIPWRRCAICGRVFIPSVHQSKYCGEDCRQKAKELNETARNEADTILKSLRNAKNYSRMVTVKKTGNIKTTEQAFAFFDRIEQLHSEWKRTNRAMVRAVKEDKILDAEYRAWIRSASALNENRNREPDKFFDFLKKTQQKYKNEFGELNIFF